MKISERELETLCDIARAAGEAVMKVYGGEFVQSTKQDASPVTQADVDADAIIRAGIAEAFPGVFVLSEESEGDGVRATDPFFLVDPLDGTKEFLNRNGEFTVNIALVFQGQPIAGVVSAPALDEMFYAADGHRAAKRAGGRCVEIRVAPIDDDRPLRVLGSRSHEGDTLQAWLDDLCRPYSLLSIGSSLKLCRIAEGRADIYPRFGPTSQWDTAAGHSVLAHAGGSVTDLSGRPLTYGLERSILNPFFAAVGDARLLELLPQS